MASLVSFTGQSCAELVGKLTAVVILPMQRVTFAAKAKKVRKQRKYKSRCDNQSACAASACTCEAQAPLETRFSTSRNSDNSPEATKPRDLPRAHCRIMAEPHRGSLNRNKPCLGEA